MNDTTFVVIAIVAALAVLGVVVAITMVTIPIQIQQAEAGCERGPAVNRAFPNSGGRCFHP
jgi:hypothetical protein